MLTDPDTLDGIECIRRSVVLEVNEFIDEIDWWRDNLHDGDELDDVVRRMPLKPGEIEGLLRDLQRLDDISRRLLLTSLHLAVDHANGIDVDWSTHDPVRVDVHGDEGNVVHIVVHVACP